MWTPDKQDMASIGTHAYCANDIVHLHKIEY